MQDASLPSPLGRAAYVSDDTWGLVMAGGQTSKESDSSTANVLRTEDGVYFSEDINDLPDDTFASCMAIDNGDRELRQEKIHSSSVFYTLLSLLFSLPHFSFIIAGGSGLSRVYGYNGSMWLGLQQLPGGSRYLDNSPYTAGTCYPSIYIRISLVN